MPTAKRNFRKSAFTLVELLVVIAIISILAAMLLPSLERSLEMARRVSCLNDRRQNGFQITFFSEDTAGLLPAPQAVGQKMSEYQDSFNFWLSGWGDNRYGLGTLVHRNYVSEPGLLYCKDFGARNMNRDGYNFDLPQYRYVWDTMVDGDEDFDNDGSSNEMGVVKMYVPAVSFTDSYGSTGPDKLYRISKPHCRRLTLSSVASNWSKTSWSPMLVACATYSTTERYSHGLMGVNAVFFDGSARWISREEVLKNPTPIGAAAGWEPMKNTNAGFGRGSYFNCWTFQYAKPSSN